VLLMGPVLAHRRTPTVGPSLLLAISTLAAGELTAGAKSLGMCAACGIWWAARWSCGRRARLVRERATQLDQAAGPPRVLSRDERRKLGLGRDRVEEPPRDTAVQPAYHLGALAHGVAERAVAQAVGDASCGGDLALRPKAE